MLKHNNKTSQRLHISRLCKPIPLFRSVFVLAWMLLVMMLQLQPTFAMTSEVDMGTTLVALKFEKGVIVGADTRTSVSGYVSNKLAQKIHKITTASQANDETATAPEGSDFLDDSDFSCVICRSGSAADTQWLCQEGTSHLWERKYRYCLGTKVEQLAHFLRHLIRTNHQGGEGLQASLICAGCDEEGKIFTIAPSGTLLEEDIFAVSGSGSTILLGHLDSLKISTDELYSEEEAVELVTKLLRLSIGRDGSSGGLIRLVVMTKGKKLREITVYPDAPSAESASVSIPGFANAEVV